MANYQNLKAAISAAIRTNGNQEITGQVLQNVLNSIVSVIGANYTFAGVATPATNPGTPDQNVFYIATQGGTYTNFGATALPEGISLLMWNGSWTAKTIMYNDGGVFDISVYKSTGGTLAKFADLGAALGTNGANIPAAARKGGMSVKFVQSSDNKYVQYRLMSNTFNTTVTNWQGVEDELFADSDNLVRGGGVFSAVAQTNLKIDKSNFTFGVSTTEKTRKLPFPIKYGDKVKIKLDGISTTQTAVVKYLDTENNVLDTIYLISSQGGENSGIYKKTTDAVFVSLFDNATTNSVSFEVTREGNISEKLTISEEKIQNLRDFDGYFYDEYALSDYNQIPIPLKTPIDNIKYQIFLNAAYDSPLGTYTVKFYDDLGNVYPDNNGISLYSSNNWSWSAGNRQWENITKMLIFANNSNDYSKHIKIEYLLKKSDGIEANNVYDISAANAIGGTLATYVNLAAALGTGGANIPQSIRKGGMSIKFVQTDDNKYVQYRLMLSTFTGSQFANSENWQGVEDELFADSDNLVRGGGVFSAVAQTNLKIDKSNFTFGVSTTEKTRKLPFPIKYGDKVKIKLDDISTTQTAVVKYLDAENHVLDTIYLISSQGGEINGIYRKDTNAVFVSLFDNATTNSVSFEVIRDGNISEIISIAEEKIQNLRDTDGGFYDEYTISNYNLTSTPLKTPLNSVKYNVSISSVETPVGVYVIKFYDSEGTVYPDNNGISLSSSNNWLWSAGNRQWENITKMLIFANNSNDYSKHIKIEQTVRKEDTSFVDIDESSPISWEITTPVLLKASIKKGDIVLFDVGDKTNNHTFVVQPRLTADGENLRTYYFIKGNTAQYGKDYYDIRQVMADDSEYLNIWDNNGAKTAKITWYKQGTLAYKNFVNNTERAILTKPLSFVGSVINNMTNPIQSMVELANSLKWKQSAENSVSLKREDDKMIHGSTMAINSQGKVFIMNNVNPVDNTEDGNDPDIYLRLTTFYIDTPQNRDYYEIQKCGQTYDLLNGGTITISNSIPSYDSQIAIDDNDNVYILFTIFDETLNTRVQYRSLWDDVTHTQKLSKCTFTYKGETYDMSAISVNNTIARDYKFNGADVQNATPSLCCTYSKRIEDGVTWYYIGWVVGNVPAIFKTQDFSNFVFYTAPDYRQFDANYNITDIQFEMPVVWIDNYLICELRMSGLGNLRITRGIMLKYNATTEKWEEYCYIPDANARGTFITTNNGIYLFHNINDRSTAALRRIDVWQTILAATFDVQYCNLDTQICYLDTITYNGELYAAWTSGTKSDIRFNKLPILEVSEADVTQKLSTLFLE